LIEFSKFLKNMELMVFPVTVAERLVERGLLPLAGEALRETVKVLLQSHPRYIDAS